MTQVGWRAGTISAGSRIAESSGAQRADAEFFDLEAPPSLEMPSVIGDRDELQIMPADKAAWTDADAAAESSPAAAARAGKGSRSDRMTLPLLCVGICLIACCVLIPQADANRRLAYESRLLRTDLESLRKQADVYDQFLTHVADDPNLAERLAQRQLRYIRQGTKVLQLNGLGGEEISPFHLLTVTPPPAPAPYEPRGGFMAGLCYNARTRIYVMGGGLMLVALALVMGVVWPAAPGRA